MIERILCDCDHTMGIPGLPIDDGQALLYIWGRYDLELLGITTTFGNGSIDKVYEATEWLLDHMNKHEIPLYRGAGSSGQAPTSAAKFLAHTVATAPGEITILALGPLGNLNAASKLDPLFFQNVKQIAIMGGVTGPLMFGNQLLPETNLSLDPEAAYNVLSAGCPITLMNAHICLQAPFGMGDISRVRSWDEEIQEKVITHLKYLEGTVGVARDYLWDVLPAVYISYPDLFDENLIGMNSTVEDLKKGMILAGDGRLPSINMPKKIQDIKRFNQIVDAAWENAFQRTNS